MSVCFTSNRSIPIGLSGAITAYHHDISLDVIVAALSTGALFFSSSMHEFELENPLDHEPASSVFISTRYRILITLSSERVFVWDMFREVEGMKLSPVQALPLPAKAQSLFLMNGTKCYIGLSNGKVHAMDVDECANAVPIPRYASKSLCDVGAGVTAINAYDATHLLFGTCEGTVKVMKLESKKLAFSVKPPQSSLSVVAICPLSGGDLVQFAVCYDSPLACLVSDGTITHVIKNLAEPAKYIFTSSVLAPEASPLIAHLANNRLVRLDGPKWSHTSDIADEGSCLSLRSESRSIFVTIERTHDSLTKMNRYEVSDGLGPLKTLDPIAIGSLSLSALGRLPIKSIGLPRNDRSLEPHLIRLCNALTSYPQSPTERFVFDFNGGLWEGVIASVFNGPSELVFSIYTQTTVRVIGRIPIPCPHLAIVTCFSIDCLAQDRWSLTLGFSNGQVGVMESILDFPNPNLQWKDLWLLDAPDQIHSGAKIVSVDRSLFGRNLVTSVDVNGMVCFTRIDEAPGHVSFSKSASPAHVAISGEGGGAFPDSANNRCFIAVSGGGIERIKTPKLRKDGSEDIHDSEVWSATTVIDSIPLEGSVVRLFPSEGFGVYSDGIAVITFSAKSAGKLGPVSKLKKENGSGIFEAETFIVNGKTYLVVLTDTYALAYDSHGSLVFRRPLEGSRNPGWILQGTMHVLKWGESLTSLAFADRAKVLSAPELLIRSAQKKLNYPPIRSTPFMEQLEHTKNKKDAETLSEASSKSTASKQGFFKRHFGKPEKLDLTAEKFKPTENHLIEARAQLHKNLEMMAKLQNNAEEMQNASADFLKMAQDLNDEFSGKSKKKKKFLGII